VIPFSDFIWASGIEDTFIPQTRAGLRSLDEYALTQHYSQWKTDFDLAAEAGVRVLRWGIPWHRVQPAPNCWDWRWVDEALDYMVNVRGITPIIDLMHYGCPLWLDNGFINAGYPIRVAEYARAVAARYKSLACYYTPLNEPTVTADLCGRQGLWPPYLRGEDGYVKVLVAVARGIILAVNALKAEQPEMKTIQVEALWNNTLHPQAAAYDPALARRVVHGNARQYLCSDLTTGRVDESHILYEYLTETGLDSLELKWFRDRAVQFDVMGANFYPWSFGELFLGRSGRLKRRLRPVSGEAPAALLGDLYRRYRIPVMVTETSAHSDFAGRRRWMDETIAAVRCLREQGTPVTGYTWFPLMTMIRWEYRKGRGPISDYLLHLGLYDSAFDEAGVLRRQPTPLVRHYQEHMGRAMPPVANIL